MISFIQVSARITLALRTFLFSVLGFCFAWKPEQCVQFLDGAVVGAVLADYLTWFIHSLIQLPRQVLRGCFSAVISFIFGWVVFHYLGPVWQGDAETTALAAMSFLLIGSIKVIYYSLGYITSAFIDDEEEEDAT
jgi:hypothetical protein